MQAWSEILDCEGGTHLWGHSSMIHRELGFTNGTEIMTGLRNVA